MVTLLPQGGQASGLQSLRAAGGVWRRVYAMHSPNSPQIRMQCINLLHATARGTRQEAGAEQEADCNLGRHSRQLRAVAGTGKGEGDGDGAESPRRQSADWPACLWQTCALNA